MPLDARMRARSSGRNVERFIVADRTEGVAQVVAVDNEVVKVTAVAVGRGQGAVPPSAYRFDFTGSVVLSGDTTVNDDLIALAQISVLLSSTRLPRPALLSSGTASPVPPWSRMAALHTDVTQVGSVARTHPSAITLAEEQSRWAQRAGQGLAERRGSACAERLTLLRDHLVVRPPHVTWQRGHDEYSADRRRRQRR